MTTTSASRQFSPRPAAHRRPLIGAAAIALAIAFNVPYAVLATTFDYPDVLRHAPGEVLQRFAAGGPSLVLAWYAFAMTALALVPVAIALTLGRARLARDPGVAIAAAIAGSLAGLAQAIGLARWAFAVPALAHAHVDAVDEATRSATAQAFTLLNGWGGVGIGEHLGQWLTVAFVCCVSVLQWRESRRATAWLGGFTALAIAVGAFGGLALALGGSDSAFLPATIAGYTALTLWLIATGVGEWRGPAARTS